LSEKILGEQTYFAENENLKILKYLQNLPLWVFRTQGSSNQITPHAKVQSVALVRLVFGYFFRMAY